MTIANLARADVICPLDSLELSLDVAGGKGANLGAMTRAGMPVPGGLCVTSAGYPRIRDCPRPIDACAALDALDGICGRPRFEDVRVATEAMRSALAQPRCPQRSGGPPSPRGSRSGPSAPLAVRSTATAEDLPTPASRASRTPTSTSADATRCSTRSSAAGSRSSRIARCSIAPKNGSARRSVSLAVVVQTAHRAGRLGDHVYGGPRERPPWNALDRRWLRARRSPGGGLISRTCTKYDRRARRVLLARPGDKAFAIRSAGDSGTTRVALDADERAARCLSDAQVTALAVIAERVETLFGGAARHRSGAWPPRVIHVLQARPITALFPVPGALRREGAPLRTYVSFGHIQMMLDPMPTLAREVWQYWSIGEGRGLHR